MLAKKKKTGAAPKPKTVPKAASAAQLRLQHKWDLADKSLRTSLPITAADVAKKRKPEVTEVTSSDSDKSVESDSSSDSTDTGNDDDEDSSSDEKPSPASGSRKKPRPTGGKQPIGANAGFKVFNSTAALTDVTATTLPRHDGSTDNQHCTLQQHG